MPNVGPMELLVVLIVALVIFGPKRIPEMGRSIGHGMREFKNSIAGNESKPELESGAGERGKTAEAGPTS
ncbi:MAG TPA: twin-arginine translocase TatA/TatE family subunit [Solirubrobacterales bacterium]|jgi:sec-independent protein translocase protein TatA